MSIDDFDTVEEMIEVMIRNLSETLKDAAKFDNGTAAAGGRVKKALMQNKKDSDFVRKEITTTIKKG